jgi:hypothetical protein
MRSLDQLNYVKMENPMQSKKDLNYTFKIDYMYRAEGTSDHCLTISPD